VSLQHTEPEEVGSPEPAGSGPFLDRWNSNDDCFGRRRYLRQSLPPLALRARAETCSASPLHPGQRLSRRLLFPVRPRIRIDDPASGHTMRRPNVMRIWIVRSADASLSALGYGVTSSTWMAGTLQLGWRMVVIVTSHDRVTHGCRVRRNCRQCAVASGRNDDHATPNGFTEGIACWDRCLLGSTGVANRLCSRWCRAAMGCEDRRSRPVLLRRSSGVRAGPSQLLDPKSAIDAVAQGR
jgi:hypothetical protein